MFTVLVFGLATAPFIFTKVVKVLIKHGGLKAFAFVALLMMFWGVLEHLKQLKGYLTLLKKIYFIVVLFIMITNRSGNQDKNKNI